MEPRPAHTLDAFRLEPPPGSLWRGDVWLALRPRSLAMLRSLVAHAGAGISCTSLAMAGDACRSLAHPWSLMPGKPRGYGGTCGQHTTVMLSG
jgi:hypothetical protein